MDGPNCSVIREATPVPPKSSVAPKKPRAPPRGKSQGQGSGTFLGIETLSSTDGNLSGPSYQAVGGVGYNRRNRGSNLRDDGSPSGLPHQRTRFNDQGHKTSRNNKHQPYPKFYQVKARTEATQHRFEKFDDLFLTLGARASGNRWEHVRNIEGRGTIYLPCDHQPQVRNISYVLPNFPDFISNQQLIITFPSQLKRSHHVSPHSMWVTSLSVKSISQPS